MSGGRLFANQLPSRLGVELTLARQLGVTPLRVGEPGFDAAIGGGTVKWALTATGELLFVPKFVRGVELAHTVITQGDPVRAAGEAEIVRLDDRYGLIGINAHSGHYQPDQASLRIGERAFDNAGIIRL